MCKFNGPFGEKSDGLFVDLGAELSKKVWSGRRTCRATAPDTGRTDTICFGYGLPVGTRVSTFKVCFADSSYICWRRCQCALAEPKLYYVIGLSASRGPCKRRQWPHAGGMRKCVIYDRHTVASVVEGQSLVLKIEDHTRKD